MTRTALVLAFLAGCDPPGGALDAGVEPVDAGRLPPASALPAQDSLPDPFVSLFDGRAIATPEDWRTVRAHELTADDWTIFVDFADAHR